MKGTSKRQGQDLYVFTVSRSDKSARASFTLQDPKQGSAVEVLGEGRNLTPAGGRFEDDFAPYAVHLYKIRR